MVDKFAKLPFEFEEESRTWNSEEGLYRLDLSGQKNRVANRKVRGTDHPRSTAQKINYPC